MSPICALDWQHKQIFRGRLALALAGERAQTCSNPRCGRARHCRAVINMKPDAPRADCPLMTEAEWNAVVAGMRRVREFSPRWYRVQDAAWDALVERIPKAKRAQVLADFERWKREQPEEKWIPYYGDFLWTELVGDIVRVAVDDIRKAERELVAKARASGCLCAQKGIGVECGEKPIDLR
jgi:hypothetical protein